MTTEFVGSGWAFPLQVDAQGGLALTSERKEIEEAIQIILRTTPGERVMRPSFGSRLHEVAFAPVNNHTIARVQRIVEESLGMWEPRITVLAVVVRPHPTEDHYLLIEVTYEVKSTHDRRSLVHPFYLIAPE